MIYKPQFTPVTDTEVFDLFHLLFPYHPEEVERLIAHYAIERQEAASVKDAYLLALECYCIEMNERIAAKREEAA